MRRLALLFTFAFAVAATAGEWKEPDDKALHEPEVKDFVAYVKALKKVGGTWHGQTHNCLADIELKAVNEASVDRVEIAWVKPRALVIAKHLVLQRATEKTWKDARERAENRKQDATRKLKEIEKNGPKELAELDETAPRLATIEKRSLDTLIRTIVTRLEVRELEVAAAKPGADKAAVDDKRQKLQAALKKDEESYAKDQVELDRLRQQRNELVTKLTQVGQTDGLKQIAIIADANADLEEIAQAENEKAAGNKLEKVLEPSVPAVKSQLAELEKALAELGSPVFGAFAKK